MKWEGEVSFPFFVSRGLRRTVQEPVALPLSWKNLFDEHDSLGIRKPRPGAAHREAAAQPSVGAADTTGTISERGTCIPVRPPGTID